MATCKLEGEIVLSTAVVVGTFGGFTITMPAGRYFLNTIGSGGATRSFCDELEFQMESSMGAGSSSVTIDDNTDSSNGAVEISRSSAFDIVWSSTTIRDLLAFTGDRASSATHTTTGVQAQYLYLPNCGRSGIMAPEASDGAIEADYTLSMGTDGTPYAISYSKRYKDSLEFRTLKGSKTWTSKVSITNAALERFYGDVISKGLRLRFHADRSSDSTFRTWVVEDGGSFEPKPVREDWSDGSESLWGIRWVVRKTT